MTTVNNNNGNNEFSLSLSLTLVSLSVAVSSYIPHIFLIYSIIYLSRYVDALSDFDRSLQCGFKEGVVYNARAMTLRGMGRLSDAVNDLNAAVELDPKNVTFRCR